MGDTVNRRIAVIGAGPIGLAAAAHLVARGAAPIVLEAGESVGAQVLAWGHVQVFSPWRYNVDAVAASLLRASAWKEPDPDVLPTGSEIVADYLQPLAALPQIAPHVRLGHRVVAVARAGFDKVTTPAREALGTDTSVPSAKTCRAAGSTWSSSTHSSSGCLPVFRNRSR